jgi:hypothetical protein
MQLLLEKELNASQAATMAESREVSRLKRELSDSQNQVCVCVGGGGV